MITTERVSPEIYDREYFLKHRDGGGTFAKSKGKELSPNHKYAIELAALKPTDRVLDVGCGCGEVALNAGRIAQSVLAIDYSKDAIELALEAKKEFSKEIQEKVQFMHLDVDHLQTQKENFDIVFFLDVIEHLVQEQITDILACIYNSLKPGGRIITHTWPNKWHYDITYPLSYSIGKITGSNRPKNPRTEHQRLMHVTEQSPTMLKRNLKKAGFQVKVFLRHDKLIGLSPTEWLHYFLHAMPPLKWFFCDHIWGIGTK